MEINEETISIKLWGSKNYRYLVSSYSLFDFGMEKIDTLKEIIAEVDGTAAERITPIMLLGLKQILTANPYDLRDVTRGIELVIEYAFGDSFIDYRMELETHLLSNGQIRSIQGLDYKNRNDEKDFKPENTPWV